jgi:hypothetical protein
MTINLRSVISVSHYTLSIVQYYRVILWHLAFNYRCSYVNPFYPWVINHFILIVAYCVQIAYRILRSMSRSDHVTIILFDLLRNLRYARDWIIINTLSQIEFYLIVLSILRIIHIISIDSNIILVQSQNLRTSGSLLNVLIVSHCPSTIRLWFLECEFYCSWDLPFISLVCIYVSLRS